MSVLNAFFAGVLVGCLFGITVVFWYADRLYYQRTGKRPNYFVFWKRKT